MSEYVTEWVDQDFRPATAGWRVMLLDRHHDNGVVSVPMPGWLVQVEERTQLRASGRLVTDERPRSERPRRVVASVLEDGEPMAYDLWVEVGLPTGTRELGVYGPGEPDPTEADVAEVVRRG